MVHYDVSVAGHSFGVDIQSSGRVSIDGQNYLPDLKQIGPEVYSLKVNDRIYNILFKRVDTDSFEVWVKHDVYILKLQSLNAKLLDKIRSSAHSDQPLHTVKAPMPGLVTQIRVNAGDIVHPGTPLIFLEAMKMENEIRSTLHGKVKSVQVRKHVTVEKEQPLLILEQMS